MAEGNIPVHNALIQSAAIQRRQERRDIVRHESQKVTICDGTAPELVRAWLRDVQTSLLHLEDVRMLHDFILATSSGSLRYELQALIEEHRDDIEQLQWDRIQNHVLAAYVSPDHAEYQKTLLRQVRQMGAENILAYNRRFREAALTAYPPPRTPVEQREMVKLYGRGLFKHSDAKYLVAQEWPATIELAYERMQGRETGLERVRHLDRTEEPMEVGAMGSNLEVRPKSTKPLDKDPLEKKLEQIMTKLAALEASQKVEKTSKGSIPKTPGSASEKRQIECYYCHEKGHVKRSCPQFLAKQKN